MSRKKTIIHPCGRRRRLQDRHVSASPAAAAGAVAGSLRNAAGACRHCGRSAQLILKPAAHPPRNRRSGTHSARAPLRRVRPARRRSWRQLGPGAIGGAPRRCGAGATRQTARTANRDRACELQPVTCSQQNHWCLMNAPRSWRAAGSALLELRSGQGSDHAILGRGRGLLRWSPRVKMHLIHWRH